MRVAASITALVAALGLSGPAAAHTPDGPAFVAAFREACVPQRLSYEGTQAHARELGWRPALPAADPELNAAFTLAEAEMAKDAEPGWTYRHAAFGRMVGGKLHYLVVTRIDAPDIITLIGCYLYDFGATAAIDPGLVTQFLGTEQARYFVNDGLEAWTWGPPPALPRTLDTNMTFVAEDSPHVELTGFSGLVLKFETSEPNADAAAQAAQ